MQSIGDQLLLQPVSSLAAVIDCIPEFNTAQLKVLLLKLLIPTVEEVSGCYCYLIDWTYHVRSSGGESTCNITLLKVLYNMEE